MHWDRFDICRAYYWFLANYHHGQGSPEYIRLCRLSWKYRPSSIYSSTRLEREDSNAGMIYRNLVARLHRQKNNKYNNIQFFLAF